MKNNNSNKALDQREEWHCLQCLPSVSLSGSKMERLGWRSGSTSREFPFLFCAKLDNSKSQLWVFRNDRKCFLDILDVLLQLGPTVMGYIPAGGLRSCSVFHQATSAQKLDADGFMWERRGSGLPGPDLGLLDIGHRIFMSGCCILMWILHTPNSTSSILSSHTQEALFSLLKESNSWQSGGLHLNSTLKTPYTISSVLRYW